jgi:GPH family glycoside/pentoside/hexuronide:cation symporter
MEEKRYGVGTMASYGMGKFLAEFLTGAYGAIVYKYYETTVGLGGLFVALATIIYSLWNAVNDPLMGYATNRTAIFGRRFGRRFIWIVLGLVSCSLLFVAIFAVPASMRDSVARNPFIVFLWMVLTICLFDGSYSMWEVNYQSVYPDKFRTQSERTKAAAVSTAVGVLGVAAGFIIPPMFFEYDDPSSFLTMALIVAAVTLAGILLLIPGIRETKAMIDRYRTSLEGHTDKPAFFSSMRSALRYKELISFLVLLFLYQSGCMCMTSSVHYVGDYILQVSADGTTTIFAGMLAGALLSIPLWMLLAKRLQNNQRMLIVCSLTMAAFAFPMTFTATKTGFTVFMTLWGIGFGGFWTFMGPAMADVVDHIVVTEKRRQEGIHMGIRAFFMRFSIASQALVFYIVHESTRFDENNVTELAKFGIKLHMAAIPALFFLVGALLFWKTNTLTPARIKENRSQLALLDI